MWCSANNKLWLRHFSIVKDFLIAFEEVRAMKAQTSFLNHCAGTIQGILVLENKRVRGDNYNVENRFSLRSRIDTTFYWKHQYIWAKNTGIQSNTFHRSLFFAFIIFPVSTVVDNWQRLGREKGHSTSRMASSPRRKFAFLHRRT